MTADRSREQAGSASRDSGGFPMLGGVHGKERTPGYRISVASALLASIAACTLASPAPAPTAPPPDFRVLMDIGIFGGPPELPPPYFAGTFQPDTFLVVVDRGAAQNVREVEWNGDRWEAVAGMDGRLIPAAEEGPYLTTLTLTTDDGFSSDATVLLGRVPNGAIARFEVAVDGVVQDILIGQRPMFVTVFPAGSDIGREFTAFDLGTTELDRGPIHGD